MVTGGLGVDTHISPITLCQHLMFVGLVSPCAEPVDTTQATTIHNLTVSDAQNQKESNTFPVM